MNSALNMSFSCLLSAFVTMATASEAQQVILESTSGDNYVMHIQPENSFKEVMASINEGIALAEAQSLEAGGMAAVSNWDQAQGFRMVVADNSILIKAASKPGQLQRSYYTLPTAQEKTDISYIVNTLSNQSLLKIKGAESSLKRAGDRITQVHPLQFLAYVFTNEELKVSMRNLEGRSWVWKEFLKGLTDTLAEENAAGRVMPYAQDFAGRIGIDANLILPSMQSGKWEKLIEILIKSVPRQGDFGRYDM